jgi:protease I
MSTQLQGKTIAILVDNGFEQAELTEPRQALEDAGATTQIVSPQSDTVRAWQHIEWGETFNTDVSLDQAHPAQYDALVLPGGVMNPDNLRTNTKVLSFVRSFFNSGKPIATICHGPWTLIDAGVVQGLTMTSYPSLKTDLSNAGAQWVDQEVVVDQGIISSRNPGDLPAFNATIVAEFVREPVAREQPTTSTHSSFEDGTGTSTLGYDSPPVASSHISNEEYKRASEPNPDLP